MILCNTNNLLAVLFWEWDSITMFLVYEKKTCHATITTILVSIIVRLYQYLPTWKSEVKRIIESLKFKKKKSN